MSHITLTSLEQDWFEASLLKEHEEEDKREIWKRLIGTEREWFQACKSTVKAKNRGVFEAWLSAERNQTKQAILQFDANHEWMMMVHLHCAKAAAEANPQWTSGTLTVEEMNDRIQAICNQLNPPPPKGLLRDLITAFLGGEQTPEKMLSFPILLVDKKQKKGIVANLKLELISNGNQELYPHPSFAFVERNPEFRKAEENACQLIKNAGLWLGDFDVRWQLSVYRKLEGNSAGGVFTLGLSKLFMPFGAAYSRLNQNTLRSLRKLDLSGVAITASVDGDGALDKVDGVKEKLYVIPRDGHIHTVVVAEAQRSQVNPKLIQDNPYADFRLILADTFEIRHDGFRVIPAETFDAAIKRLTWDIEVFDIRFVSIPPFINRDGTVIQKRIYLAETPISQKDWARIMGQGHSGRDSEFAQVNISLADVESFCIRATHQTRKELGSNVEFRIPSYEELMSVINVEGIPGILPNRKDEPLLEQIYHPKLGLFDLFGVVYQYCKKDGRTWLVGGSYWTHESDFRAGVPKQRYIGQPCSPRCGFRPALVLR